MRVTKWEKSRFFLGSRELSRTVDRFRHIEIAPNILARKTTEHAYIELLLVHELTHALLGADNEDDPNSRVLDYYREAYFDAFTK